MIALKFLRSLTPRGVAVLLGAVLVAIIAGLLLWNAWSARATAKAEARLSKNQTEAALESGADAVGTVGAVGATEVQIDVITRENERAIREAPGADAPVDPALRTAGLQALCRRAAYRGRPECLQFAPAR
jgi:type II secretory pathway component PulM